MWVDGVRAKNGTWSTVNDTRVWGIIEDLRPLKEPWIPANKSAKNDLGCATLLPSGIIKPWWGNMCKKEKHSLCEYKACFATDGEQCIFPFNYRNISLDGEITELVYDKCTSISLHRPWCPTSVYFPGYILVACKTKAVFII